MREADRIAIEEFNIPSLQLMEQAGGALTEALLDEIPELQRRGMTILCGKGNNGGDGLVVLRLLAARGVRVDGILIAKPEQLSTDAAANYEAALAERLPIQIATDRASWAAAWDGVDPDRWILDALLGTGVRGEVRGLAATVIEDLSVADVISVDLPSGQDADSHLPSKGAVRASYTLTLARPKPCLALPPAASTAGRVRVLDIGIPAPAIERLKPRGSWQNLDSVQGLLPPRDSSTHKGQLGHLLVVAGSEGCSGAAVLTGRGALRSGAGLVTIATAASCRSEVAVQQAELMTQALAEEGYGGLAAAAVARIQDLLGNRDALVIGPGLGLAPATIKAVRSLAVAARRPTLIDADGLNAIASGGGLEALRDAAAARILTPHPGEAARLLGTTSAVVQADRLTAAQQIAERSGAIVVLKGEHSLIMQPNGEWTVNVGGNAGMATAGSGDLLSGIIGAFLARGLEAVEAARLGVYVHAEAGDRAAAELGEDGMIASDIAAQLPATMRHLQERG